MSEEHAVAAAGREPAAARRMTEEDKRLVGALVQIEQQLPKLIAEILAGDFDADERRHLSLVFATIAGELTPPPIVETRPPWLGFQDSGPP